jgi:hypothetical protein
MSDVFFLLGGVLEDGKAEKGERKSKHTSQNEKRKELYES